MIIITTRRCISVRCSEFFAPTPELIPVILFLGTPDLCIHTISVHYRILHSFGWKRHSFSLHITGWEGICC